MQYEDNLNTPWSVVTISARPAWQPPPVSSPSTLCLWLVCNGAPLEEVLTLVLTLPEIFLLLKLLELLSGGQTGSSRRPQSSQQTSLPLVQQLSLERLGSRQLNRMVMRSGVGRQVNLHEEEEELQAVPRGAALVWRDSQHRAEV